MAVLACSREGSGQQRQLINDGGFRGFSSILSDLPDRRFVDSRLTMAVFAFGCWPARRGAKPINDGGFHDFHRWLNHLAAPLKVQMLINDGGFQGARSSDF